MFLNASLALLLLASTHAPARVPSASAARLKTTAPSRATLVQLEAVRQYIRRSWRTLTRSPREGG